MGTRKKILYIVESFRGGVFAYLTQLCNDMCDDFEVYLAYSVCQMTPKNYREFLDPRIHLIKLTHLGEKGILNVGNDIKTIRELRNVEKQVEPDIIHLQSSIAGGVGRLAFWNKANVIYTPHAYAHVVMQVGLKSKVFAAMEWLLGRSKGMTLTCCESEDEEAKKLCRRTAYVTTGVNLEDLSATLDGIVPQKGHRFTVFSLGRVCFQKQPQLFNRIAELVPDVDFLWIGGGEMESSLTAPNIRVTGWKPRKEALALAKGADVFILCSCGEAIAMSLIENMYMKKLCMVSNTMGNKSVIKNGVNGYICDTAEEYAAHVRQAKDAFPNELVEEAYHEVQTIYNTHEMKKAFVQFYMSLIAQQTGGGITI